MINVTLSLVKYFQLTAAVKSKFSGTKAAFNSETNFVNKALSVGLEPAKLDGYSQSKSKFRKKSFYIIYK